LWILLQLLYAGERQTGFLQPARQTDHSTVGWRALWQYGGTCGSKKLTVRYTAGPARPVCSWLERCSAIEKLLATHMCTYVADSSCLMHLLADEAPAHVTPCSTVLHLHVIASPCGCICALDWAAVMCIPPTHILVGSRVECHAHFAIWLQKVSWASLPYKATIAVSNTGCCSLTLTSCSQSAVLRTSAAEKWQHQLQPVQQALHYTY
jgi:hypothetical protein